MSLKLKAGDIVVAAAAVAATALILILTPKAQATTAELYRDGKLYASYELANITEPVTIEFDGDYHNTIEITDEGIRFVHSDCPDGTCVSSGLVDKAGEFAACVPNRVMITVAGQSEFDATVG